VFWNLIDKSNPDIILGCETCLNPSVGSQEVMPPGYNTYRKDRSDGYGGVLMAFDSLIVYSCTSYSRIFHLYGYVTIYDYRWRVANCRPMLGAQGLWAGRDLYRAIPAVTRALGLPGLIRRTTSFSRLLRHKRGCGGSILTGSSRVPIQSPLTTRKGMLKTYFYPDPHGCSWLLNQPIAAVRLTKNLQSEIDTVHITSLARRTYP
jgi:hypothetical protein